MGICGSKNCLSLKRLIPSICFGQKMKVQRLLPVSTTFAVAILSPQATASSPTNRQPATCGIDARMMRFPDISATQIAFAYAGDIWVAPKTGGESQRLSSPKGEETFPRFSPDGSQIAFSGNYDGNTDIYVIPSTGGLPKRLTYHGDPDR